MLVLSRKERERVRVGESIVLTIVRVSGGRVRLGIEAPDHMAIVRDELGPSDAHAQHLPPLSAAAPPSTRCG
jgi:carbon storage regulator